MSATSQHTPPTTRTRTLSFQPPRLRNPYREALSQGIRRRRGALLQRDQVAPPGRPLDGKRASRSRIGGNRSTYEGDEGADATDAKFTKTGRMAQSSEATGRRPRGYSSPAGLVQPRSGRSAVPSART